MILGKQRWKIITIGFAGIVARLIASRKLSAYIVVYGNRVGT